MQARITLTQQENGAVMAVLEFDPPLNDETTNPVARAAMIAMDALSDLDRQNKKSRNKKKDHICACASC